MRIARVVAMGAAAVVLGFGLTACNGDTDDSATDGSDGTGPAATADPEICSVYAEMLGEGGLRGIGELDGAEGQGAKYREVAEGLKEDGDLKDAWKNYGDYLDLRAASGTDSSKLDEFSEKSAGAPEWIETIKESVNQCP